MKNVTKNEQHPTGTGLAGKLISRTVAGWRGSAWTKSKDRLIPRTDQARATSMDAAARDAHSPACNPSARSPSAVRLSAASRTRPGYCIPALAPPDRRGRTAKTVADWAWPAFMDSTDQLFHFLFVDHSHAQGFRLVELRSRIETRNHVIGLLADRARDTSSGVLNQLLGFIARVLGQRAGQNERLARELVSA